MGITIKNGGKRILTDKFCSFIVGANSEFIRTVYKTQAKTDIAESSFCN
jgi:hypothetical protein